MKNDYKNILIENSMASKKPNTDIARIRSAMMAEYDAVNMYEKFAEESLDDKLKKVFLSIANEEKTHIGEFEEMLVRLDPSFIKNKNKGKKEIDEM